MSLYAVLTEDWSDYDIKKIRNGQDARYFSCTEAWEVEYLRNKIKKHNQILSDMFIKRSILECWDESKSPYPREKFLACVANRLGIPSA